jgi:bifunctional non-homologous end joining protein LigD
MKKVEITHPDKILFPKTKITKQAVVDYYASVAKKMLPLIKDRPISMKRYPNGIKAEGFFQKNAPEGHPSWLKTVKVKRKEGGSIDMILCNDKSTLLWMANQNCITPHIWLSKYDKPNFPDMMVFDLDPPTRKAFSYVVHGAIALRKILEKDYKLKPHIVLTGSKGLHVVVSIKRTRSFDEVRALAKEIASRLCEEDPKRYTLEMTRCAMQKGQLLWLPTPCAHLRGRQLQCPFPGALLKILLFALTPIA